MLDNLESIHNLADEQTRVEQRFRGRGIVVAGRITRPTDVPVASRTKVWKDGSFCTSIYGNRKLVFLAHGYDPLEVNSYDEIQKGLYYAGLVEFKKSAPENIRKIEAVVSIANNEIHKPTITSSLYIVNQHYLYSDATYSGGNGNVIVTQKKSEPGTLLTFEGLSRLPYRLGLTSHGYIAETLLIDPVKDGTIDLGNIVLKPAAVLRVTHKARIKKNGSQWTQDETPQTTHVTCDGINAFVFSKQRDGWGNRLELGIFPKDEVLEAKVWHYKHKLYDLGTFPNDMIPDWDDVDMSMLKGNQRMELHDGHLYLYKMADVSGTECDVFFRILKTKPAGRLPEKYLDLYSYGHFPRNTDKIESLTAEQAAILLAKKKNTSLSLSGLTSINKNVAQEFGKFTGYSLKLDGLNSIEQEVAHELAKYKRDFLNLNGLNSIERDVAHELAKYKGKYLYLNGLTLIDKETAHELAHYEGRLFLNSLTFIDKKIAAEFAESKAYSLYFDDLTSIDKEVARELAKCKAFLALNGLTSIDKDTAHELGNYKGFGLLLNNLITVDKDTVKELSKVKGSIHLGLNSIDKYTAKEFANFKGDSLGFASVTSIDKEVVRELVKFDGERLLLNGLSSIDKEVARELVKFDGEDLYLGGLTSISTEVALELINKKDNLYLKGLTSIDDETLKILKSHPSITLPEKYQN